MPVTVKQIEELETFFATAKLPKELVLDAGSKAGDIRQLVQSHLNVLKHNGDKTVYDVFYDRLLIVKELVADQQ